MGCFHSRRYIEETKDEAITNNETFIAMEESQLNNDASEARNESLQPHVPITATNNPSVTSSISQSELYHSEPKRRETVTSPPALYTVNDNEEESVMIAPTLSTPTSSTVNRSLLLAREQSVNEDVTEQKIEEPKGKPQGTTTLPNEIEHMEPPVHENTIIEYTEPTEATLCTQEKSEEEPPSSSDTPPLIYQARAVEATVRLGDVDVTLRDGDNGFVEMSLIKPPQD